MRTTRAWIVAGCLLSGASFGATHDRLIGGEESGPSFVPAGLESRGQNFVDLPTPEVAVGELIGTTGAQDEAVTVYGEADGELVMFTLENRKLWAATSGDGGATFAPAVQVAGAPTEGPIGRFRFAATWNTLYVAYTVGDPGGDVGLSVRRSVDMGRTWSAPFVLIARGNPRHGLLDVVVHANGAGRVAVLFKESWEGKDVYAMVSSDHASTWTAPVRLDAANAEGVRPSDLGDVHVSDNGTVHAIFVQNRGAGNRLWYTRSTDGGSTFSPEVNFDALVTPSVSASPDLTSNPAGTILLSFWDRTHNVVDVLRSANDGVSFTLTAQKPIPASTATVAPKLLMGTNFPDVLLAYQVSGELRTWLSQNSGASFDWTATVASGVDEFDMARTLADQFVLAWSDTQRAPAIYAAVSQGGVVWGPAQRADQGLGASAESILGGVTIVGTDTAWLAYLDRRDDNQTQYNVYAVDASAGALDFTARERRVDTDAGTAPMTRQGGMMATDGVSHSYLALYGRTHGPEAELWITRSSDGGRTYQPAQKLSSHDTAVYEAIEPVLRALPDGSVYVVWRQRRIDNGLSSLMFARSTDFGATWTPEAVLAAPLTLDTLNYTFAATTSAVVVLWSDRVSIWARRSTDHGTTFSAAVNVDDSPTTFSLRPIVCTQGSRIVLAYEGNVGPWARVSSDAGSTWAPGQQVYPFSAGSQDFVIACDSGTTAVLLWQEGASLTQAMASRLSGSTWSTPQGLGGPADQWYDGLTWAGGTTFMATFGDFDALDVYTSRSTNGGLTWSAPIRHDTAAPQPLAFSTVPQLTSDGAGNVWLAWWDTSAGAGSIAARFSSDAGATWSPVRRADRSLPQGASSVDSSYGLFSQAGVGFVVWGSYEKTLHGDIRVNAWDAVDLDRDGSADAADCDDEHANVYPGAPQLCDGIANDCNAPGWPAVPANETDADGDGLRSCADNCPNVSNPSQADLDGDTVGDACDPDIDGDGVPNGLDCAPMDPGVGQGPAEVVPIAINKPTSTTFQIAWSALAGATAYDVVRGTVTQLRTSGNTGGATGMSCSQAGTTYSDTKPIPAGTTWYFLVRGRAGACLGTYGADSAGVPRMVPPACP
jgi:hypothetical protein